MASVFQRNGCWYLRVKSPSGAWEKIRSSAQTKTEAKRLAAELERKVDRQRMGLEAPPAEDGGGTLAELMEWWLQHTAEAPASVSNECQVRKHLINSDLAPLRLVAVTTERIEAFLHAKDREGLAPQTVNYLRGFLSRAFGSARKMGRYSGPNPAATVQRRKVPRRAPDYLRAEEVAPVLNALDARWQPLFATAIYAGLRKGELLGLRKSDVDLGARLLTVARSYDRDTTKGGHADVIPIAAELVPYLQRAMESSPSELVFPAPDGTMMRPDVALEAVLRRAMGRAGVVTGYRHVCRRKGCTHAEVAADAALRRCPEHNAKLWPKPQVRPIRFHSTRHSTASLLMMSGANPAAVQRILRHSDPRITTDVYGHLAPEYLRAEVDRLTFGVQPAPVPEPLPTRAIANSAPFVPVVSPGGPEGVNKPDHQRAKHLRFQADTQARQAGLEPTTLGLEGRCSIQLSYRRGRRRAVFPGWCGGRKGSGYPGPCWSSCKSSSHVICCGSVWPRKPVSAVTPLASMVTSPE